MSDQQRAVRFFWGWLIAATVASIAGNVAHAALNPGAANPAVAAAAAVVPPVVLLGATHGVHALVRSRIVGGAYRAALCITVALALCAFVLSFEALRELAIVWAGIRPAIAWLWPLSIDLSITGSTVALLALTGAQRAEQLDEQPAAPPVDDWANVDALVDAVEFNDDTDPIAYAVADLEALRSSVFERRADAPYQAWPEWLDADAAQRGELDADPRVSVDPFMVAAARILAAGVTRIDRVKIAEVLREHADDVAPSTIARKLGVGYDTVVRILDHHRSAPEAVPA